MSELDLNEEETTVNFSRSTISIYQNPDHVSGVLQQTSHGLITNSEEQRTRNASDSSQQSVKMGLDGKGEVNAGFIKGNIGADGENASEISDQIADGSTSKYTFSYLQAYYLDEVKNKLKESSLLHLVSSVSDAENLTSGDFVEFKAKFAPSEVSAALDILSTELVGSLAFVITHKSDSAESISKNNLDDYNLALQKNGAQATLNQRIAESLSEALRVDFRSNKTREYYGTIGLGEDKVTAVVICDAIYFIGDEDRILDGEFTVLGKVTSSLEEDVPVLSRNKILNHLNPKFMDDAVDHINKLANEDSSFISDFTEEKPLTLKFSSRISGKSFKVIPVAIYA